MTIASHITLRHGTGYASLGDTCWVAKILGPDWNYGQRRLPREPDRIDLTCGLIQEFLEPIHVAHKQFAGGERTITECTYALEPDTLYECFENGKHWFMVCPLIGATKTLSDDGVHAYVQALDTGRSALEAWLAAKKATP